MTMIEKMNQAEEYILHTYNRFPVVFERGEGVCLYDTEGKEYLDFAAAASRIKSLLQRTDCGGRRKTCKGFRTGKSVFYKQRNRGG